MPISIQEAETILKICQEYIPVDKVRDLFLKLDNEIGKNTDNQSLQKSLQTMRLLVDPPKPPASWWMKPIFQLLVAVHLILIFAMLASFILLPFNAPWYIAVPVMAFIFFFSTTKVECKLTELENYLRRKIGMKQIGGFVGFYFIKPTKRFFSAKKKIQ